MRMRRRRPELLLATTPRTDTDSVNPIQEAAEVMCDMANWEIIQGHCKDVLKAMPAESVACVVTSPPYRLGTAIVRCIAGRVEGRSCLQTLLDHGGGARGLHIEAPMAALDQRARRGAAGRNTHSRSDHPNNDA